MLGLYIMPISWIYIMCMCMCLVLALLIFYSDIILSYFNIMPTAPGKKPLKMVVFDLDETLGYFTELSIFWDALEAFNGHNLLLDKFIEVMDTFPEFTRPDILHILDFIHTKRMKKQCNKIIIYTNNQGPKSWATMISDYFDTKLGYKVFDQIIGAYKVNGKQIEPKRTSHEKSLTDFINCAETSANIEVCFIDDLYHPLMDKSNVYYINIKPYRCSIPFDEMAERYYDRRLSRTNTISRTDFTKFIVTFMKKYNYMVANKSVEEINTDKIASKKLLENLAEFLVRKRNPNTRKNRVKRIKTFRQKIN
jgi:hypothetical protein